MGDDRARAPCAWTRLRAWTALARYRLLRNDPVPARRIDPPRDASRPRDGRPGFRGARLSHHRTAATNPRAGLGAGRDLVSDRWARIRGEHRARNLAVLSRALDLRRQQERSVSPVYLRRAGVNSWSVSRSLEKSSALITIRFCVIEYVGPTFSSFSASLRKIWATVPGRSSTSMIAASRSSCTLKPAASSALRVFAGSLVTTRKVPFPLFPEGTAQ